jgi:hypothetical protein
MRVMYSFSVRTGASRRRVSRTRETTAKRALPARSSRVFFCALHIAIAWTVPMPITIKAPKPSTSAVVREGLIRLRFTGAEFDTKSVTGSINWVFFAMGRP